jgi:hypothetical protein
VFSSTTSWFHQLLLNGINHQIAVISTEEIGVVMITEEYLAKEFTIFVDLFYPEAGELLHHCYAKVIQSYWGRPPKSLRYVAIYCPSGMVASVAAHKDLFRKIAQNMGLAEVVCLSATRLLRHPMFQIKQTDPRFWLELLWIVTQEN